MIEQVASGALAPGLTMSLDALSKRLARVEARSGPALSRMTEADIIIFLDWMSRADDWENDPEALAALRETDEEEARWRAFHLRQETAAPLSAAATAPGFRWPHTLAQELEIERRSPDDDRSAETELIERTNELLQCPYPWGGDLAAMERARPAQMPVQRRSGVSTHTA